MRASDYEAFSGRKVGFDATARRFHYKEVFYGQSLKYEMPGPGQYTDQSTLWFSILVRSASRTREITVITTRQVQQLLWAPELTCRMKIQC